MSLFRRPKHARHTSRRREVVAALAGTAVGAIVMAGVATGATTSSGPTLSMVNGQRGTVTCSDGSALELQPVDISDASPWCFNPFVSPTTTTTTQPPATTTTTAPPTTTTVPPTTTTTTQPPPPPPPPPPSGLLMGSYNGAANPQGATNFGLETNTPVNQYSDYTDSSNECSGDPWPIGQLAGNLGSNQLILSVPLPGFSLGKNGQSLLASIAANPSSFDACMTNMATYLVNGGFGNAIIRLMWEPDSGIYSNEDLTSARNYATVWRDAWNAMQIPNQHFKWAWYWGANFDNTTNTDAYPGSQYVDYVTFDQYDQSWDGNCGISWGSTWTAAQSQCIWNDDISKNLAALHFFASGVGKPIGIGEWGVINRGDGHGGLDDPTFINNMSAWLKSTASWESYFNFNSGGDSVLGDFPNSLAAFKADLG